MSAVALERTPRRRKAFGLLVGSEIKLAWRYPVGLIVSIGVPLVLVVIFGIIPPPPAPTRRSAASRSSTCTCPRCWCSCSLRSV